MRGRLSTWALTFFGFLALYLATLSQNFSPDSMAFATLITQGDFKQPLFFQAEHLLYPTVGWLWYQFWGLWGYREGALLPLQVLNALFGAGGAAFFGGAIYRLWDGQRRFPWLPLTGGLLLGATYGYWYHSTDAEDQIIAISLTLASFFLLTTIGRKSIDSQSRRLPVLPLTGFCLTYSLAILIHATQVLFLPTILLGLWTTRRPRIIAAFFLSMGLFLGLPYLLVGQTVHRFDSARDYLQWITAAPSAGVWGRFSPSHLWQGLKTIANSIAYMQGGPNLGAILQGDGGMPNALSLLFLLGLAGAFIAALTYWLRHREDLVGREVAVISLAWMIPFGLFNLYWAPEDIQFWINLVPPGILIVLGAGYRFASLHRSPKLLGGGLALLLIGLLSFNLVIMAPRRDLSTNKGYAQTRCLEEHTRPADLIVSPGWDWVSSYGPYFAHRQVLSIVDTYLLVSGKEKEKLQEGLRDRMAQARLEGGRVYIVRLFDLKEAERAWLKSTTGLQPEDFRFERRPAWSCGGETAWEVDG